MLEKPRKKSPKILIAIVFVIILIGLASSFVYRAINPSDYTETYNERMEKGEIVNPVEKYATTLEEIEIANIINMENFENITSLFANTSIEEMEKEFIYYAAVKLKIYNLQEIPFTSIRPQIQIQIDNRSYFVEVSEGEIFVNKGLAENPDIILKTGYEEIFKMTEADISESFSSGKSEIEIVANKFVLFSKGYLNFYRELGRFS